MYAGGGIMPTMLPTGEPVMLMPTIPMGMDIPPGLEYLFAIGSAHVQQKTDALEMMSHIDTPNKYMIYNDQGQFIYYAQEVQSQGEFVMAQLVGDSRGFRFQCTDALGRVVFTIYRSSKLGANCDMVIEAPPGIPCGYAIFQSTLLCRGMITVTDQFRRPILTIPFPSQADAHLADRGYPVMMGAMMAGAIVRKFPGFMKQALTNCDNFALTFPAALDVKAKCTLLACAILIDFIDFEDKRDATRGKVKTISPQAQQSLGNPYQNQLNMGAMMQQQHMVHNQQAMMMQQQQQQQQMMQMQMQQQPQQQMHMQIQQQQAAAAHQQQTRVAVAAASGTPGRSHTLGEPRNQRSSYVKKRR